MPAKATKNNHVSKANNNNKRPEQTKMKNIEGSNKDYGYWLFYSNKASYWPKQDLNQGLLLLQNTLCLQHTLVN